MRNLVIGTALSLLGICLICVAAVLDITSEYDKNDRWDHKC